MIKISNMILEYNTLIPQNIRDTGTRTKAQSNWHPPPPGTVKLNVDASYSKITGRGSYGIVGTDFKGDLTIGLTKTALATSPLLRKLWLSEKLSPLWLT